MDEHQVSPDDSRCTREMVPIYAQIAVKCQHLARTGRPDLLWTVNMLARSVTE